MVLRVVTEIAPVSSGLRPLVPIVRNEGFFYARFFIGHVWTPMGSYPNILLTGE